MGANRGTFHAASFLIPNIIYVLLLALQVAHTSGLPTTGPETFCGEGHVWDDTLRSCVSCTICRAFPETPVCTFCSEVATSRDGLVSDVTQAPCEEGSVYDSFQKGCVSCGVCKTHPDTPICAACDNRQAGSPQCPVGRAWDPFLRNCMSCTICETHPDTYICQVCPTPSPSDPTPPPSDEPGRLIIILAAVVAFLFAFILVLVAFFIAKFCLPPRYRQFQCCGKEPKGDQTKNGQRIAHPVGGGDSGRSSMVSSRSGSDTCVMEPLQPKD